MSKVISFPLIIIFFLSGCSYKNPNQTEAERTAYKSHDEQYKTYKRIETQTNEIRTLRKDVESLSDKIAGKSNSIETMCYDTYNNYVQLSTEYRHSNPKIVQNAKRKYINCEYRKSKLLHESK